MGFLGDLRYFGPVLGPRRGLALAIRKSVKALGKAGLARALREPESVEAAAARLGLPRERAARWRALRESWAPLAASEVLAPVPRPGEPAYPPGDPVARLREEAEAVAAGRQVIFGDRLEVGWPPRWSWRWDGTGNETLFSRDLRSTWEVQRLQGILPLAAAARVVPGREGARYALLYLAGLGSFRREHPGPGGPAWASALELGLRLIGLAQGLPRVVDHDAFEEREGLVLGLLDRHARWLAADLSLDKVVRGNHLLGELAGLLAAGCLIPEARPAWWGTLDVQGILEAEILRQFHPDGVSVEQSLPYEVFILQFLTVAGEVARLRGEPFSGAVRSRLLAAARHLEEAALVEGDVPRVGDCDSGRGACFGDPDPHRVGAAVSRARTVFAGAAEADAPAEAGAPVEVHEGDGVRAVLFPDGGHAVLRGEGGDALFLRGGPFGWGVPGPASHSHADWLAPVLVLGGEPVLVDPGVFGYGVGGKERDRYRTWVAHGGYYPSADRGPRPAGTFRWSGFEAAASLRVLGDPEGVRIHGEVRWSGRRPLLWQRSIHYNRLQRGWRIRDRLEAAADATREWGFVFAPGVRVVPEESSGVFRLDLPSGRRFTLRLEPPGPVRLEPGWVASAYGSRREATVLVRGIASDRDEATAEILPG